VRRDDFFAYQVAFSHELWVMTDEGAYTLTQRREERNVSLGFPVHLRVNLCLDLGNKCN